MASHQLFNDWAIFYVAKCKRLPEAVWFFEMMMVYIYIYFFSHRWWYLRWWSMGYVNIIFLVMINFYANFTGLRFSQWRSWWFGLRWSSPSGEINGDFVGWIHYWVELMETWGYLYFEKPTILYLYTYIYIYIY
jgi:hypothetical protein